MNLSEIRQILASGDIRLTKSLGQNFLHDGNQLRRIITAAELKSTDQVLEIGPGLGPLTEMLVQKAGHVLAIEKDRRLIGFLRERFAAASNTSETKGTRTLSDLSRPTNRWKGRLPFLGGVGGGPSAIGRLTLLHDDALDYVRREAKDWSDWKLVANLPYAVASPILVELARAKRPPERLVATLQHEVAQRLTAKPGDEAYGLLSLLVQLGYQPEGCFKIPARCFYPVPDVDSGCVTLTRRPAPLLGEEHVEVFAKILKRAFSQRRKMMLKLLKEDWPLGRLEAACALAGLTPQVRAESVGLEQFVRLARALASS